LENSGSWRYGVGYQRDLIHDSAGVQLERFLARVYAEVMIAPNLVAFLIRDKTAVAKPPADEQEECKKLSPDVEVVLRKA
jgi:hypothetical protein